METHSHQFVVLYHAGCRDGFGAALAAKRALPSSTLFKPVQYGAPLEVALKTLNPVGLRLTYYILDFSYPRAELEALAAQERTEEVLVIDHHKSAQEQLGGLPDISAPGEKLRARFDNKHSGAVLAWQWFHADKPVPELFQFLEDRDLWMWNMPGSRAVNAVLQMTPLDWNRWEPWIDASGRYWPLVESKLVETGNALLEAQRGMVKTICAKKELVTIGDHQVPAVNSPILQSELGEQLLIEHEDAPFVAVWWEQPDALGDHQIVVSLRSHESRMDVAHIAKHFGGGGHRNAAGFSMPAAPVVMTPVFAPHVTSQL